MTANDSMFWQKVLDKFNESLEDDKFLQAVWDASSDGDSPTFNEVEVLFEQRSDETAEVALQRIPDTKLQGKPNLGASIRGDERLRLTVEGLRSCAGTEETLKEFLGIVRLAAERWKLARRDRNFTEREVSSQDLPISLKDADDAAYMRRRVGNVLFAETWGWGQYQTLSDGHWRFTFGRDVWRFRDVVDIADYLARVETFKSSTSPRRRQTKGSEVAIDSEKRYAVMTVMRNQTDGELHSFFVAHGYGNVYSALPSGWGKPKRIAQVITAAEQDGKADELLLAAARAFGETSEVVEANSSTPIFNITVPTPPDLVNPETSGEGLVPTLPSLPTKAFIVHGRDPKNQRVVVARTVERSTALEAIILNEQVNAGRTLIEKLKAHATGEVVAIVLATGDDVGFPANHEANAKPRARQNVILELGYFIAKLPPERVIVLKEASVEMPSDFDGVVYIDIENVAWAHQLGKELHALGIEVDFTKF